MIERKDVKMNEDNFAVNDDENKSDVYNSDIEKLSSEQMNSIDSNVIKQTNDVAKTDVDSSCMTSNDEIIKSSIYETENTDSADISGAIDGGEEIASIPTENVENDVYGLNVPPQPIRKRRMIKRKKVIIFLVVAVVLLAIIGGGALLGLSYYRKAACPDPTLLNDYLALYNIKGQLIVYEAPRDDNMTASITYKSLIGNDYQVIFYSDEDSAIAQEKSLVESGKYFSVIRRKTSVYYGSKTGGDAFMKYR